MKNIWLTLLASIILLGIVFLPKKEPSFEIIITQVLQGNEVLEKTNNLLFKAIEKQVKRYPQYGEYLEKVDTVRQIVKQEIENQNTDLESIIPKLTNQITQEYDYKELRKNLQYLDLWSIKHQSLDIALSQSELLKYETGLLNFFAEKVNGTCIGRPMQELLMLNNKNHVCIGKTIDWKYMVSSLGPCYQYNFKIWLNDELLVLNKERPYKSTFKLKPTKTGQNTFEITIEGRNREGDLKKVTREFEYEVVDVIK